MTGGATMIAERKKKNVYLELEDKPAYTKRILRISWNWSNKSQRIDKIKRLHVFFKDRK